MRLFVLIIGVLQATKYVNVTYDSSIIDKAGFKFGLGLGLGLVRVRVGLGYFQKRF